MKMKLVTVILGLVLLVGCGGSSNSNDIVSEPVIEESSKEASTLQEKKDNLDILEQYLTDVFEVINNSMNEIATFSQSDEYKDVLVDQLKSNYEGREIDVDLLDKYIKDLKNEIDTIKIDLESLPHLTELPDEFKELQDEVVDNLVNYMDNLYLFEMTMVKGIKGEITPEAMTQTSKLLSETSSIFLSEYSDSYNKLAELIRTSMSN